MRESNFLSTGSNRASLAITQTLYDRRALDCTSDKPLVNSLQQLMYLTASSGRVRETLCYDGGLERIIAIMKECRVPEEMAMAAMSPSLGKSVAPGQAIGVQDPEAMLVQYKWHLCMQCLLNLGSRGSESVRRRIVEAGALPVIATILDNYLDTHGQDSVPVLGMSSSDPPPHTSTSTTSDLLEALRGRSNAEWTTSGDSTDGVSGDTVSSASAVSTTGPDSIGGAISAAVVAAQDALGIQTLGGDSRSNDDDNMELDRNAVALRVEQFMSQFSQATGRPPPVPLTLSAQRLDMLGLDNAATSAVLPRTAPNGALLPREKDVGWALEILAFVSKYAHLKNHIQNTHLVPQLSVRARECLLPHDHNHRDTCEEQGHMEIDHDGHQHGTELLAEYACYDFENNYDVGDEYQTPRFNLFELVERFTVHRTPRDFPHWAGIIMRNSCRKDESRGGIRQCANFQCGRWEEVPREFPKCRRCKRPKYCSKQCQLKAWSLHRYWCSPPNCASASSTCSQSSAGPSERPQSAGIAEDSSTESTAPSTAVVTSAIAASSVASAGNSEGPRSRPSGEA